MTLQQAWQTFPRGPWGRLAREVKDRLVCIEKPERKSLVGFATWSRTYHHHEQLLTCRKTSCVSFCWFRLLNGSGYQSLSRWCIWPWIEKQLVDRHPGVLREVFQEGLTQILLSSATHLSSPRPPADRIRTLPWPWYWELSRGISSWSTLEWILASIVRGPKWSKLETGLWLGCEPFISWSIWIRFQAMRWLMMLISITC